MRLFRDKRQYIKSIIIVGTKIGRVILSSNPPRRKSQIGLYNVIAFIFLQEGDYFEDVEFEISWWAT